ncbi:MAG TPA: carbohydrate kinase [Candidatus Nanopelagicaceae bacterium]
MSIWVCGEILIDVLPQGSLVAGGPANTAMALALLGKDVEFIGVISTDEYGDLARRKFSEDGVSISHVLDSAKPTAMAKVSVDEEGIASYVFSIDGTATFDFNGTWLPDPSRAKPALLHIGSLATIVEPGAKELYEWAMRVGEFAPIVYDPNVRPAYLSDRDRYHESVEDWISIASVVKASEDDLTWLYPGTDIVAIAKAWITSGVDIVVVTKGAKGLMAVTSEEVVEVPGLSVGVVDTVGAGDTVGAIISKAILENGLENLRGKVLREALDCAALAAAITCSRAGMQPPTKSELEARRIEQKNAVHR